MIKKRKQHRLITIEYTNSKYFDRQSDDTKSAWFALWNALTRKVWILPGNIKEYIDYLPNHVIFNAPRD